MEKVKIVVLSAVAICLMLMPIKSVAQSNTGLDIVPSGMNMKSRVPVATVSASTLDFTKNQDASGNVSFQIPLLQLGGAAVALKYYSKDVAVKLRTPNQYAPSGEVGLGWQLLYGSISAEINNSADTSDDNYFYNGPDGSYELVEGPDGTFRIPNFKPWVIKRMMDGNTIIGWEVTKSDGTILRFGNYDKSSGQFLLSYGTTNATRFFLGVNGLVANPDPSLYGGLSYIPYQWDLSNIQDVEGNQTTLLYQQIDIPLVCNGSNSASVGSGWEYTRESHLSEILDNKGQEVHLTYAAMPSDEYFDDFASWDQHLANTLSLDSIDFVGDNGTLYKKIAFSYDSTVILQPGITKSFLDGFQIEDANSNPLPSYSFQYCGASSINPGAISSVTEPDGGTVTYAYQTQSLSSVQLSYSGSVPSVDYYDYADHIPDGDGMAGKDFIVVRSNDMTLHVYREGPDGWYLDSTFPSAFTTGMNYSKVGNDYVVLFTNDTMYAVKETPTGWRTFNVNTALTSTGDALGPMGAYVVGIGPNYFVVEYNEQGSMNIPDPANNFFCWQTWQV
ncbi:MAG: hypothetical protein M1339_02905, partial [Bacteroidetes bacterium]|nr:hypothetical protein [Bacteroidota bacterium]